MIDLYAIINDDQMMELFSRIYRSKHQMETIVKIAQRTAKGEGSKLIKRIKIGDYYVYYFKQASFVFMLGTQLQGKVSRMQSYLRVVADIFYENYDQSKFHYVLDRIMEEINKSQFGNKITKQNSLEDQESSLVHSAVLSQKMKIHSLVQKRQKESMRAYAIITLLFLGIIVLSVLYLTKKWN